MKFNRVEIFFNVQYFINQCIIDEQTQSEKIYIGGEINQITS